jgi:hypothetical protein
VGPRGPGRLDQDVASVLVEGLRAVLMVTFVPLDGVVAVLDTTAAPWALHLDADSPAEDHCWVMIEVLDVLRRGPHPTGAPPRTS